MTTHKLSSSGVGASEGGPANSEFEFVDHAIECRIDPLYERLYRMARESEELVLSLIENVQDDRRLMIQSIVSDIENIFADGSEALTVTLRERGSTHWLRDRGIRPLAEAAFYHRG